MTPLPAPPAEPSAPMLSGGKKTWSAGTLVYTSGGLLALFCWLLLGDFAWSMRERSVGPMAQWYLSHLDVPNIVFGLLLTSFPAAVSFVLVPIMSVKSDRHRGRLGRRIPFLLFTAPLASLGMLGLAASPFVASWVHSRFPGQSEMLVSVACFALFWAAFEFATIASYSLFGALINDVVPKELLGRFFGLFRAVSLIDGMIFNYWIIGRVPEHFSLIMAIVGVFYGAAFSWVCFKIKEGRYPPPPPRDPAAVGVVRGFWNGALLYLRECFTKPYYVLVFFMMTAGSLASAPVNIFAIPYARSLGVNMDTYGKCVALTYLISLGMSYFIGWLVDRFHPLRVGIAALLAYAVVMAWGWSFATTADRFLVVWVTHGVIAGCYATSTASLGQRLFPREKYAQFASAKEMVYSPGNMLLAPLVGLAIDGAGKFYGCSFLIGGLLALAGLCLALLVHRRFVKLGGAKGYAAPV